MRMTLSPLERAILSECATWRCLEELHADLAPLFDRESVQITVAFLRRRQLLEGTGSRFANNFNKRTADGTRALHRQRRRDFDCQYIGVS